MRCKSLVLLCLLIGWQEAQSEDIPGDDWVSSKYSNIIESHALLQQKITEYGAKLEALSTSAQAEVLHNTSKFSVGLCPAGVQQNTIAASTGIMCMTKVAAEAVMKQIDTQLHCFLMMKKYGERILDLGRKSIECSGDAGCVASLVASAGKEEIENHELVSQKLKHVWELQQSFNDARNQCIGGMISSAKQSDELCRAGNVTGVGKLFRKRRGTENVTPTTNQDAQSGGVSGDDWVSTKYANIIESHAPLQQKIAEYGAELEQMSANAQAEVMHNISKMSVGLCPAGVQQNAIAASTGVMCMTKVAAEAVMKQVETQLHCFLIMKKYAERIVDLGRKSIECKGDAVCVASLIASAGKEEIENHELVSQKLNHVWELKRSLNEARNQCIGGIVSSARQSDELCQAGNVTGFGKLIRKRRDTGGVTSSTPKPTAATSASDTTKTTTTVSAMTSTQAPSTMKNPAPTSASITTTASPAKTAGAETKSPLSTTAPATVTTVRPTTATTPSPVVTTTKASVATTTSKDSTTTMKPSVATTTMNSPAATSTIKAPIATTTAKMVTESASKDVPLSTTTKASVSSVSTAATQASTMKPAITATNMPPLATTTQAPMTTKSSSIAPSTQRATTASSPEKSTRGSTSTENEGEDMEKTCCKCPASKERAQGRRFRGIHLPRLFPMRRREPAHPNQIAHEDKAAKEKEGEPECCPCPVQEERRRRKFRFGSIFLPRLFPTRQHQAVAHSEE